MRSPIAAERVSGALEQRRPTFLPAAPWDDVAPPKYDLFAQRHAGAGKVKVRDEPAGKLVTAWCPRSSQNRFSSRVLHISSRPLSRFVTDQGRCAGSQENLNYFCGLFSFSGGAGSAR